jgi:non-heme chloroperoxidase
VVTRNLTQDNLYFGIKIFSLNLEILTISRKGFPMKVKSSADGTHLYVFDTGKKNSISILFIHGWRQSHIVWKHQLKSGLLNSCYRLVAFDLRGHGLSDKPLEESKYNDPALWGDDIDSVIKARKLDKIIICAWSSGATFLCDYINKYGTNSLIGIVLIDPNTRGYGRAKPTGKNLEEVFLNLGSDKISDRQIANEKFLANLTKKGNVKFSSELYFTFLGFNLTVSELTGLTFNSRGAYSCTPTLEKINCPSLVIQGKHDAFVAKEDAEEDAKSLKAQFIMYDNSGHSPFFEEPRRFNEDLHSFIFRLKLKHYATFFHLGGIFGESTKTSTPSESSISHLHPPMKANL